MIGPKLRRIREGLGLNLQQAAVRTGVSVATLSRMENGRQGFTQDSIQKIADGYGVDPQELFVAKQQREVPMLSLSEAKPVFVNLGKLKTFLKTMSAVTEDPNAFYIVAEGAQLRGLRIAVGDLLLVEPNAPITNGSTVIALVKDEVFLGQFFQTDGKAFIQPQSPLQVPVVLPKKRKMFRITKFIMNA